MMPKTLTRQSAYPCIDGNVLSRQVKDVDHFNQTFQDFGLCMTQLSPGGCEGQYQLIQIADLQLIRIFSSCAIYTQGAKPSNKIPFSLLLSTSVGELVSHKTSLPQKSLFGFDGQREINLITPKKLDLVILNIPVSTLQTYLEQLERPDLDEQFFKQNHIQITTEAHSQLQAYLRQIFHLAKTNPDLVRRSQPLIHGDLLPLLFTCLSREVCPRSRVYPFRRAAIVQAAEAYMNTNLNRPVSLQEVCQAVKVSKSALSYGFQDVFRLSPMAYLKIQRLKGVRNALKKSNPESDLVIGIAHSYGFWHMGHFSTDYKRMFGESPSDTLQRTQN